MPLPSALAPYQDPLDFPANGIQLWSKTTNANSIALCNAYGLVVGDADDAGKAEKLDRIADHCSIRTH
jgi:hypothetical protein